MRHQSHFLQYHNQILHLLTSSPWKRHDPQPRLDQKARLHLALPAHQKPCLLKMNSYPERHCQHIKPIRVISIALDGQVLAEQFEIFHNGRAF